MKRFTAIAASLLLSTGLALAQTPSGNDGQTNRGAQPVQPGNQSGSSDFGDAMTDPYTGYSEREPLYGPRGGFDDDAYGDGYPDGSWRER